MIKKIHLWKFIVVSFMSMVFTWANLAQAQTSSGTSVGCTPDFPVPAVMAVKMTTHFADLNVPQNYVVYSTLEDYVYGVVMGELGPTVPLGAYAGATWDDDAIKAQSVAVRTWGAYNCNKHYFSANSRGVLDVSPDQQYHPNDPRFSASARQRVIDLSAQMKGLYASYDGLDLWQAPFHGKVIDAQYRRDVGNPSCSWNANDTRTPCYGRNYKYLSSVNNPFASGYLDGPGFAQLPAHSWTQQQWAIEWYQLLMHDYTGVQIMNKQEYGMREKFWNNITCSGQPVYEGWADHGINYDWNVDPRPANVPATNFCAEWSKNVDFTSSYGYNDTITFFILADDGFQLFIDDQIVLNKWILQSPHEYSVSLNLTGVHNLKLKYFQSGGGAVARLNWTPGFGMVGHYYDYKVNKEGSIPNDHVIHRPDPQVSFNWLTYSPLDTREGPRIYEDTFSVIWEGHVYFPSCGHILAQTYSDDGIVVKANGGILIDQWNDHPPTDGWNDTWVCAGTYPIEIRYYENTGNAMVWAGIYFWIE